MINSELHSFMIADLLGGFQAVILFMIYLLPPGYVIGWAGNLFSFRGRSTCERLMLSLVLSIATAPIFAVLAERIFSIAAAQCFFLALALIAIVLAVKEASANRRITNLTVRRSTWIVFAMAALWLAVALFELADLQLGHRLYMSVTAYDYSLRASLVQSALRTGAPPKNPLFLASGHAPTLRYYYYWYVLCGLPAQLAGLPARASLNASSVWCGFALAALIPLYLKYLFNQVEHLRRKSLLGIALLAVTGLDLIPNAIWAAQTPHVILADTDWWDPNQVTSWVASILWVPHHVAALIACFAGFLVLSVTSEQTRFREHAIAVATAGLAFASAAGLSVYVTFTFAVFGITWTLLQLTRKQYITFATNAAACLVALLLSLPYLHDLQGPAGNGQGFASFAFRDFPTALSWLARHHVTSPLLLALSSVPTLAVVYAIEFGFFLMVGILRFRTELLGRARLTENQRAAWVMLAASIFVATFLRSGAISSNDLGMRSPLPCQFILLLWAALWLSDQIDHKSAASGREKVLTCIAVSAIAIGVIGSISELIILRAYAPLVDAGKIVDTDHFLPATPEMGERTYALRDGYEQLDRMLLAEAVVQHNPMAERHVALTLYSNHQAAAQGADCGVSLGGDPLQCKDALLPLSTLFIAPAMASRDMNGFCKSLSIDVLVATDADPAWHDSASWVWTQRAIVANHYLRAIPCGQNIAPSDPPRGK